MTDDDKLEMLENLEKAAWRWFNFPGESADGEINSNLEVIERCQRIRKNLGEQSIYDEIRTPRDFNDEEFDVWGFELGSASQGDYARVSDGRNNMKASILGEVKPHEGLRGELALEVALGRAEVEAAARNLEA